MNPWTIFGPGSRQSGCSLLKREPFISYLSLELPTFILAPGDPLCEIIDTAATDGRRYFFNLQWCKRLTDPELGFVVGHEVGHVLYLHAQRRDERNPDRWNSACDFVINWLLLHTESLKGLICMPHDPEPVGYFDNRFANLTAEQVYDRLPELFMPSWDPMLAGSGDSDAGAIDAARGAMARALARTKGYRTRNGQGNTPGEWERMAMEGMQPTVMWQALFQMKATASGHDSHSWTRPNKRMRPHGYYLPSYRGFCLPKTLFVFDTSGSISEEFLGQMEPSLTGSSNYPRAARSQSSRATQKCIPLENFAPRANSTRSNTSSWEAAAQIFALLSSLRLKTDTSRSST